MEANPSITLYDPKHFKVKEYIYFAFPNGGNGVAVHYLIGHRLR